MDQPKQNELEELLREVIRTAPFMQTLRMELVCAEQDHVRMRITDIAGIISNYGVLHGGAMLSLADTAAGFAAMTDGRHYVSQSCSFEFLENTSESPFYADCRVLHRGRTVVVVETKILSAGQKTLATGLFNMFAVNKPFLT